MAPSIVPVGNSLITREPGSDPFTGDQPSESITGTTRSPHNVHDNLIGPDSEINQPSGMVPGRRSWGSEPPRTEAGPETADIRSASSPQARTIQPPLLDEEFSPAPRHIEPGRVRGDTPEQWPEVNAKSSLLSPRQDSATPFVQPPDQTAHVVEPSTLQPRTPDTFRPEIPPPDEPVW